MSYHYPDFSKSERKDALVPDPPEFDFSDPDATKAACQTARGRLGLFTRLVNAGRDEQKSN